MKILHFIDNLKIQFPQGFKNIQKIGGDIKVDNVGSYDAGAGIVNLVGFKSDTGDEIKLSVSPANPSAIVPSREYILKHDTTRLSAKGIRTTASN